VMTFIFKILGIMSPRLAGRLALKIFMTPPKVSAPKRETKIREQSNLSYRQIKGRKIAVRVWENTDENAQTSKGTILLSHGWAGRTSQFLEIIKPLLEAGYRVVGADIPAHGDSSGKYTNILDSTQTLSVIAKEFSPLKAIVSHSFGTGTTLLALDKFEIKSPKIVLIGAYSRVSFILNLFSDVFNLNPATVTAMQQIATEKFADSFSIKWDWKSIAPVRTIQSYQGKILFVHDKEDHEVPIDEVTELHQIKENAEILLTSGYGHRRILRQKQVVERVVDFIQG